MDKGIIYLVQPCELVGTNRYKIGCSKDTSLNRVQNGYKKGTRYLYIGECKNPLSLEKNIKDEFNDKFKLIAGREYFEGDELEITKCFYSFIESSYNYEIIDKRSKEVLKDADKQIQKREDKLNYEIQYLSNIIFENEKKITKKNEAISNIIITNVKKNKQLEEKKQNITHLKGRIFKLLLDEDPINNDMNNFLYNIVLKRNKHEIYLSSGKVKKNSINVNDYIFIQSKGIITHKMQCEEIGPVNNSKNKNVYISVKNIVTAKNEIKGKRGQGYDILDSVQTKKYINAF